MNLLLIEARRALHRRVVWALLAVALVGIALIALIVFTDSTGKDFAQVHAEGQRHPALMSDWWAGSGDSVLVIAAVFLAIGGLLGGAAVVGGEWKHGTVATVLAWEPRRLRLHAARLGACAVLAWLLAVALQLILLTALLPAVLLNGSTDGTDGAWALSLTMAIVRIGGLAALAAVLGGALATIGRSTAAALMAAGVWLAVLEAMLRAWRPWLGRGLLGENVATLVSWKPLDDASWSQPVGVSLALLVGYAVALALAAGVTFNRRDVGTA